MKSGPAAAPRANLTEGLRTLRTIIVTLAVALSLAITSHAYADTTKKPARTVQTASATELHEILRKSRSTVNWWNHRGRWALHLHRPSCDMIRDRSRASLCDFARRSLQWHSARVERAQKRMWLTLPSPADWQVAVRVAQRAYPGTSGWLLSCSASEGGYGAWVWNRQGSGAGGWMQFMESTFWRMFRSAERDITARGFVVPKGAASFYSPIGQALAGAWGVRNGRSFEWTGSGC